MNPIALFIIAVALWVFVQMSIDANNPCSAFSYSGACSSTEDFSHV